MTISPLLVFHARAEARALLYKVGEFDLEQALAPLLAYAVESGIIDDIGGAAAFAILKDAFKDIAEI
jgi:hypothetical protein